MSWLKTYPTLLKAYWARALEYRGQIIIWILSSVLPLVMMMVWISVSDTTGPIAGYNSAGFISYYLMVTLFRRLTGVWIIWDMDHDIRQGTLSPQLLKPLNPIHHLFTRVLASKPLQLILVGPPIFIASVLLNAHYDLSVSSIALALAATAGGLLIEFFAQALVGATAFWITQSLALAEAWFWIRALLSGWIIPIGVFPAWLHEPLQVLPFRYCLSFPIEIMLGRLTLDQIAFGLIVQYAWVIGLSAAFRLMWRRGLRLYGAVGA